MEAYLKTIIGKAIILKSNDEICSLFKEKNKIYSYVNPYVYVALKKNPNLYDSIDGIYFDGILLVMLFKILNVNTIRLSADMSSILKYLFKFSIENSKSLYIVGTTQKNLQSSINVIKSKYPKLNILKYRNGYFNSEREIKEECIKICEVSPDFLLVGMGTPYQESFIKYVKESGYNGVVFTCGGFFHQTINSIHYYPNWINTFHLRWLYRMIDEKRVLKRTLIYYPYFLILFFKDLFLLYLRKVKISLLCIF